MSIFENTPEGPQRTMDVEEPEPEELEPEPEPAELEHEPEEPELTAVTPESARSAHNGAAQAAPANDPGPVLAAKTSLDFRERWRGIQAEFIDDPRRAVEDADRLVADVTRAFASGVEERRRVLTSGWEKDGHGETEDLRLTMRQYRALVDHILHD